MKKIKTLDVLKVLAAGSVIVGTVVIPVLPMILVGAVKLWKDVNKTDLGRIIKRLEKQEMLTIREREGKVSIEITEKGKKRKLTESFFQKKKNK